MASRINDCFGFRQRLILRISLRTFLIGLSMVACFFAGWSAKQGQINELASIKRRWNRFQQLLRDTKDSERPDEYDLPYVKDGMSVNRLLEELSNDGFTVSQGRTENHMVAVRNLHVTNRVTFNTNGGIISDLDFGRVYRRLPIESLGE